MYFRLAKHSLRDVPVVELWDTPPEGPDVLIGQLTPGDAPGELRLTSKHEVVTVSAGPMLHLFVRFWE